MNVRKLYFVADEDLPGLGLGSNTEVFDNRSSLLIVLPTNWQWQRPWTCLTLSHKEGSRLGLSQIRLAVTALNQTEIPAENEGL